MEKVYSEQEAIAWFLRNSKGSVVAVNEAGEERKVDSFPEAQKYFQQ